MLGLGFEGGSRFILVSSPTAQAGHMDEQSRFIHGVAAPNLFLARKWETIEHRDLSPSTLSDFLTLIIFVHAHAPIKLISKAPEKTKLQTTTLFFPLSVFQLSSLRKSSDIKSTNDANASNPAEMAFITPTISNPT